ncbi:MAG: hypothetical protein GYB33_13630 [Gammaproteobacteria bacterium]|nr:hypothetical protein [Gammaproteobacteria bacterium]
MSLTARREMLASIRQTYLDADWLEKGKVLDGFVAATHYEREYACRLLHQQRGQVLLRATQKFLLDRKSQRH